jgi:2-polyprenyl-3-methyl-5-hydroxy-6-metoxy-1,4-benzoquinol methylase
MHQEVEGVLSPIIRDIRLKNVAREIGAGKVVLDLACGNLFLERHLPANTRYFGVDRIEANRGGDIRAGSGFLNADLLASETPDAIESWMGRKADIITSIAFLEHIKRPEIFVTKYKSLLVPGGKFLGTTPHPRGRHLHDRLARMYLCSRSGADEHEDFLSRHDLEACASAAGGKLTVYRQFLMGLNQLFVFSFPG